MRNLAALLALVVSVPSSAGTSFPAAERVASVAASAGLALPAAAAFEAPSFAPVKSRAARGEKVSFEKVVLGSAHGSGYIYGHGNVHCSSFDNQTGSMTGWVRLDGDVDVTGPEGARGRVRVSGSVHVDGTCRNGSGSVMGSGNVTGYGTLYKDGRPAGTANVSGHVMVSHYAYGGSFTVNEYVTVNGSFSGR